MVVEIEFYSFDVEKAEIIAFDTETADAIKSAKENVLEGPIVRAQTS